MNVLNNSLIHFRCHVTLIHGLWVCSSAVRSFALGIGTVISLKKQLGCFTVCRGMRARRTGQEEEEMKEKRRWQGEEEKSFSSDSGGSMSLIYPLFILEVSLAMIFRWERTDFTWKNVSVNSCPLRTWLSRLKVSRVGKDIFNEARGGIWLVCLLKRRELTVEHTELKMGRSPQKRAMLRWNEG